MNDCAQIPSPTPPIVLAFSRLQDVIHTNQDLVEQLEKGLDPILQEKGESSPNMMETKMTATPTKLVDIIERLANALERNNAKLHSIINRIQI